MTTSDYTPPYTKLRDIVSYALRDIHRDLATADGPAYVYDPGDPRAVEVILNLLAKELESDVHLHHEPASVAQDSYNEGVLYASSVLGGWEPCSFD